MEIICAVEAEERIHYLKAISLISSTGIISFVKNRATCLATRNRPNLHGEPPLTCHFEASLNGGTIIIMSNIGLMAIKIRF